MIWFCQKDFRGTAGRLNGWRWRWLSLWYFKYLVQHLLAPAAQWTWKGLSGFQRWMDGWIVQQYKSFNIIFCRITQDFKVRIETIMICTQYWVVLLLDTSAWTHGWKRFGVKCSCSGFCFYSTIPINIRLGVTQAAFFSWDNDISFSWQWFVVITSFSQDNYIVYLW